MSPKREKRVIIGTDHGGYDLKRRFVQALRRAGYSVVDVGTFSPEPCDYPLIGAQVGRAVSEGKVSRGILLCKSGAGMAIVANKFPHVRAAVCQTVIAARHARRHNNANILVLGAEHLSLERAQAILTMWLETPFEGGRHARRVGQIDEIEKQIRCT